jgi:energy-coupling factor transporter ATP-binding protein EcfA2
MRITKLQIRDYKCFDNLVLDNLGNRVVLVGPNGSGKSAVLEAIAVLKEYAGSYQPGPQPYNRHFPVVNRQGMGWPENTPLPIRGNQPFATIFAELGLDDLEKGLAGTGETARVGIQIEKSGEVFVKQAEGNVAQLFRHFDPESGVGVVDYISPNRTFPRQLVQNINLGAVSVQQQRLERIELPRPNYDAYTKFRTVKDFLI